MNERRLTQLPLATVGSRLVTVGSRRRTRCAGGPANSESRGRPAGPARAPSESWTDSEKTGPRVTVAQGPQLQWLRGHMATRALIPVLGREGQPAFPGRGRARSICRPRPTHRHGWLTPSPLTVNSIPSPFTCFLNFSHPPPHNIPKIRCNLSLEISRATRFIAEVALDLIRRRKWACKAGTSSQR